MLPDKSMWFSETAPSGAHELYSPEEAETVAAYLYDGGWRSGDLNDLMLDYGLEREPAEQICAQLKEIELKVKAEEEEVRLYERES